MPRRALAITTGALAITALAATSATADDTTHATPPTFTFVGRYTTGLADGTGDRTAAETVAALGTRLYVTNSTDNSLDIVDVSNPAAPVLQRRISLAPYGGGPNSVDAARNIVAVAVEATVKTDPGKVLLFDRTGRLRAEVVVGALPDMLTFTPEGDEIVVANEGEPSSDYLVDPEGSISVIEVERALKRRSDAVRTISFAAFDEGGPRHAELPADVRIFGPGASVAQDLEPEYVTVGRDDTAWVTLQENNAVAEIDLDETEVVAIRALGAKDHGLPGNGLDPSDRDGGIRIASWPVFGLYQPDAIASFRLGDDQYVITANEGDARDWNPGLREETTVRNVALDPVAFPNASALQDNGALGRLTITKTMGDTDGDGDYDRLYSLGARSFSIWDADGTQVYDSGDDLEQLVASVAPANFNVNNTSNTLDNRSDNKGPEPEGVAVGRIGGRTYAFVGLERQGGVAVYDVTTPAAPVFVQYVVSRTFATPVGPDSGPEVVRFLPADASPSGRPRLLVANETTGTVGIFEAVPA